MTKKKKKYYKVIIFTTEYMQVLKKKTVHVNVEKIYMKNGIIHISNAHDGMFKYNYDTKYYVEEQKMKFDDGISANE